MILPTTLCFAVCDQQPIQHTFLARSSGAGRLLEPLIDPKQKATKEGESERAARRPLELSRIETPLGFEVRGSRPKAARAD